MFIEIKHLVPHPLMGTDFRNSDVWNAGSTYFHPRDRVLLFAPSGKGKTSLLSIIYGLRNDYSGDVFINSQKLSSFSSKELSLMRKNHVSYIFQGLELFDELSALENVALKNQQTDFKTRGEIEHMFERLGINEFMDVKTGILSYGQRQRVAIIRALCQPYKFLLADEIFSHLDKKLTEEVFTLLEDELEKQEAGLLFTSLNDQFGQQIFTKKLRV